MPKPLAAWWVWATALLAACGGASPAVTGRLNQPSSVVAYRGCPQVMPECEVESQGHTLLLIANFGDNALRVFDVDRRQFFSADNPLFPFSVPVGENPRRLAIEPSDKFAFVLNYGSRDVSVVDLQRLVEVDTDWDSCSSFCGSCSDWDPPQFLDERCRAGVSRVSLGTQLDLFPEGLALGPVEEQADGERTLRLWVSLLGAGRVVELKFTYPREELGRAQRLRWEREYITGGRPAGLVATPDGSMVVVADEGSDSVALLEHASGQVERIELGAPSSVVRLAPDGKTAYVLLPERKSLALVDLESKSRRWPAEVRHDARNPDNQAGEIYLGAIPRSLVFTRGVSTVVFNEQGQKAQDYTKELLLSNELNQIKELKEDYAETVVKNLAFVGTLDGKVRILDAENHRDIDIWSFLGPSIASRPSLNLGEESVSEADLEACEENPECVYPIIAGYRNGYSRPVDENGFLLPCGGHGTAKLDSQGTAVCECETGYFPDSMNCVDQVTLQVFYPSYGVYLRPGMTRSEVFQLTWEGVVGGTETGTRGRWQGWRLYDQRPGLNLLALDIRAGDILQIVTEPEEPQGLLDNPCRAGSGENEKDSRQVDFRILTVGDKFLEVQSIDGIDPQSCWPLEVRWRVRAASAWTVYGSVSGSQPRLQMVARGSSSGQYPAYDNGFFGLTMYQPAIDPATGKPHTIPRDSIWLFTLSSGFAPAMFSPSAQVGGAGEMVAVDIDYGAQEYKDDRIYWLFEHANAMMEFFPSALGSTNYLIYQ